MCTAAQLASNVRHEQEAAQNGIGSDGRPVITKVEDFGLKLAHQFPWAPASAVAVGLALRRRFLSDPEAPSTVTRRLQARIFLFLLGGSCQEPLILTGHF